MGYRITLLALMLFAASASAGTVTLTGTCNTNLANSNTIVFGLLNSGTDGAYNLVLTPRLGWATPYNAIYDEKEILPNSSISISMPLYNLPVSGSYAAYFIVTYEQDTSTFSVIFPCLFNLGNSTSKSSLSVSQSIQSGTSADTVTANVFNDGQYQIDANVSLFIPPSLSTKNDYQVVEVAPHSSSYVVFPVAFNNGDTSAYTAALTAGYLINNTHVATLSTFVLPTPGATPTSKTNYIFLGGLGILVLLVLLLLFSIFKRVRRKTQV